MSSRDPTTFLVLPNLHSCLDRNTVIVFCFLNKDKFVNIICYVNNSKVHMYAARFSPRGKQIEESNSLISKIKCKFSLVPELVLCFHRGMDKQFFGTHFLKFFFKFYMPTKAIRFLGNFHETEKPIIAL